MPTESDVALLTTAVLWATFAVSAIFGAIVQRTGFCTMGAVADAVTMGDWTRLRQWALAAGVAVLGFALLGAGGWIRPADSVYADARWMWLSSIVGGGLFGIGMVLSSGCGSKNLVRMGAGNLKALVVFLVMALSAYVSLRGLTAVLRDRTVDQVYVAFAGPATLGHLAASTLGWSDSLALLVPALLVGGALTLWALLGRGFRRRNNLLAGLGVGATIVAMWWVSGWLGFIDEHPLTLEASYLGSRTGRIEALTFTAPLAYAIDWIMFFSDQNRHLGIAAVSVAGVVVGAFLHALATRSFRWEGFRTTEDLANHLAGAALMGFGGVTALGCTIGQGLSGISNLSLTSFSAVASIIGGAVAALRYQAWRLERQA
ncbi:MAG TPA: YeeE/YedE family protein [Ottowia sp.]|uniref:YeeE/YedE family protein n=1 Tax=Ottowia sp. TaxID=1898956 RepID=UPI002B9E0D58|nr:YeeE/YedE family protein [Ottowia sp.]HMN22580.1 YeeE/YedE family protein [Ottowia sp.]